MNWSGGGMWMNGWAMALALAVWVVLIGAAVYALLRLAAAPPTGGSYESPRQALDRRLASGELTPDEYVVARDLLAAGERPSDPHRTRPA